MAEDAGALLVRSGLVTTTALDQARARVEELGGTIGEQLVFLTAIADDALTAFYKERLLVPQVNPNTLARLSVRVIASLSQELAIELRAIPISIDAENNLTVAMSDPSDSSAVDEIAFFTGAYVVRAVATQMQIAWCLAHYYGHVTPLGQRLLSGSGGAVAAVSEPRPRTKGLTGRVNAARHRGLPPVTGSVAAERPRGASLDPANETTPAAVNARALKDLVNPSPAPRHAGMQAASVPSPSALLSLPKEAISAAAAGLAAQPTASVSAAPQSQIPAFLAETPRMKSEPAEPASDGTPDRPRARSVSGEIRVERPARAQSIPVAPVDPYEEEESGPVITIEVARDEEPTGPAKPAPRRRVVKSDPPELYARAGEIGDRNFTDRQIEAAPAVIIAEDIDEPDVNAHGEIEGKAHRDGGKAPSQTIQVSEAEDDSAGVVIHERPVQDPTVPILLQKKTRTTDDDEVVELATKKPVRAEKRTQVGMGAVPAVTRPHSDTESGGVPEAFDDAPTGNNDTQRSLTAPGLDEDDDEIADPPQPAPPRAPSEPGLPTNDGGHDDDDDAGGHSTTVMSAAQLDAAVPGRKSMPSLGTPGGKWIAHEDLDDGWGPPGSTIPPPLLGAIPGGVGDDDAVPGRIPMSNVDSAPLIVAPPSPPETSRGSPRADVSGTTAARAFEDATSRMLDLIRGLEYAQTRDNVVELMIDHLAETHRRAGFFMVRPSQAKGTTELGLFAIEPRPSVMPTSIMRLDKPSTLQDVVGTRLPYRGPMHDDASRTFLTGVLGSCPPEILLVPVAIRERVVGVLFGEHRTLHTFDDQLGIASRAAGMALERILKSKRS